MGANKKFGAKLFIFIVSILGLYVWHFNKENSVIKFCTSYPWRNLHPGTQNTLIGGLLISQQFESLIKIDPVGNISPSIAKTWTISDDFKKITFQIDEEKKFVNGKSITADDVIGSWLNSYNMSKEGPNNSLKDVLYKIEGFDQFEKSKTIPGLKKIGDKLIEINFQEPFRLAIYHLRGARFAIYTEDAGKIIGSGKYSFETNKIGESLELKNDFANSAINVLHDDYPDKVGVIKNGKCDIVYIPTGSLLKIDQDEDMLGHIESEDAVHLILTLNSKQGLFSDVRMRRAFLYLIHREKDVAQLFLGNPIFSSVDPQIYNKLSQGRLDESEAMKIINEGKEWLPSLMEKISSEKISFLINNMEGLQEAFEKIKIDKNLKIVHSDSSNVTKVAYNGTMKEDFSAGFISVISFDPDGIYHALGRNGAVLNPYMANERLFDLLEDGRKITDLSKLDEHYKKVSRAFLEEVPFLHLGFSKNVLLYNKNRISISKENFRNTLDFSDFIEK